MSSPFNIFYLVSYEDDLRRKFNSTKRKLYRGMAVVMCTAKNTIISPDFLVWKFCGNCAFPQNFRTRKSGEITVFFAVVEYSKDYEKDKFYVGHEKDKFY